MGLFLAIRIRERYVIDLGGRNLYCVLIFHCCKMPMQPRTQSITACVKFEIYFLSLIMFFCDFDVFLMFVLQFQVGVLRVEPK